MRSAYIPSGNPEKPFRQDLIHVEPLIKEVDQRGAGCLGQVVEKDSSRPRPLAYLGHIVTVLTH
jgi:hypothetical protein